MRVKSFFPIGLCMFYMLFEILQNSADVFKFL